MKWLGNGTLIQRMGWGTTVYTPGLPAVEGVPHDTPSYLKQAIDLGYSGAHAALQMCLDHDPLHALLSDWLGMPHSYSLAWQAGSHGAEVKRRGLLEEKAVLAVQEYMVKAGGKLPL